jgi:hypothetical protein
MSTPPPELWTVGDGLLGKAITAAGAMLAGWFLRRPAEHAAIMGEMTKRMGGMFDRAEREVNHLSDRCAELEQQLKVDKADCDSKLAAQEERINSLMGGVVADYVSFASNLSIDGKTGSGLK